MIIGSADVGKSCLLKRYAEHQFDIRERCTVCVAYTERIEQVNDTNVTLKLWDTAGSERYDAIAHMYYRGASAAIVCYDITDSESWACTPKWVQKIKATSGGDTCRLYLCATKIDLIRENLRTRAVPQLEVIQFADSVGAVAFETSAKTGENVPQLFHKIAEDHYLYGQKCTCSDTLIINEDVKKKSGC